MARYAQGLGIDEPLAIYRGGKSYYYHADGLGSIVALSDNHGTTKASYTYDAFGNNAPPSPPPPPSSVTNPFRYTAREFDIESGLYYYRARYYDPAAGRFLSEDPIGFEGVQISILTSQTILRGFRILGDCSFGKSTIK